MVAEHSFCRSANILCVWLRPVLMASHLQRPTQASQRDANAGRAMWVEAPHPNRMRHTRHAHRPSARMARVHRPRVPVLTLVARVGLASRVVASSLTARIRCAKTHRATMAYAHQLKWVTRRRCADVGMVFWEVATLIMGCTPTVPQPRARMARNCSPSTPPHNHHAAVSVALWAVAPLAAQIRWMASFRCAMQWHARMARVPFRQVRLSWESAPATRILPAVALFIDQRALQQRFRASFLHAYLTGVATTQIAQPLPRQTRQHRGACAATATVVAAFASRRACIHLA